MNRVLLTTALFASLSAITQAQPVSTAQTASACPTLQFVGLKSGEGTLLIAVYGSAESFFKKPIWSQMIKVSNETMMVPVCNLDAAEIAVTAFQDMNGNAKLDSNPMGIPSEPYAASGKPALFSAPTWSDAKVAFSTATQPIVIRF